MIRLGIFAAVGAVLGSLARYGVSQLVSNSYHGTFPWATLLVNVVGAFLIGLCARQLSVMNDDIRRSFLVTGVLGGFTTFSALAVESVHLVTDSNQSTIRGASIAVLYVILTFVVGICATSFALGKKQ
jgi:CrcB protein